MKHNHVFLILSVTLFSNLFSSLQDILENESINLDWMFRYSLINDIVKVRGDQTKGGWQQQRQQFIRVHIINAGGAVTFINAE